MTNLKLRIVKIKRTHFIVAGKSKLMKCRSLEQAKLDIVEKRTFLEYWAASASVSIDSAEWVEIVL